MKRGSDFLIVCRPAPSISTRRATTKNLLAGIIAEIPTEPLAGHLWNHDPVRGRINVWRGIKLGSSSISVVYRLLAPQLLSAGMGTQSKWSPPVAHFKRINHIRGIDSLTDWSGALADFLLPAQRQRSSRATAPSAPEEQASWSANRRPECALFDSAGSVSRRCAYRPFLKQRSNHAMDLRTGAYEQKRRAA